MASGGFRIPFRSFSSHSIRSRSLLPLPPLPPPPLARTFSTSIGPIHWSSPSQVSAPTQSEIDSISSKWGLGIGARDLPAFEDVAKGFISSYTRIQEIIEEESNPPLKRAWTYPKPTENRHNAWYVTCEIQEKKEGVLAGKKVAIKDTVAVGGVPMMNGSRVLHYLPSRDATIVRRILDAGGIVAGKSACEDLCFSGGSFTNASGAVKNPNDPKRQAGGSSSGSGALVANGDVDLSISGDQGGSIRIPASWCGVSALKPTHGLVPYTGVFGMESTLDHLGPCARSVKDLALLLEVIAGVDLDEFGLRRDPRQVDAPGHNSKHTQYTKHLRKDLNGVVVGVLREGFAHPTSERDVDEMVKEAAQKFTKLGAVVKEVSIPMHLDAGHVWTAIGVEGIYATQYQNGGQATNAKGELHPDLMKAFSSGMKNHALTSNLSLTNKIFLLLGDYMQHKYGGEYYAHGRNLARRLTGEYNRMLSRNGGHASKVGMAKGADRGGRGGSGDGVHRAGVEGVDVLIMPTTPNKATVLPDLTKCSVGEYITSALNMIANTVAGNVTGHPALSIPVGKSQGLPVGMMIVGKHWDDQLVLSVGNLWESHYGEK